MALSGFSLPLVLGAAVLSSWDLESPKCFMGETTELGRGATWGSAVILDPLLQQLISSPPFLSPQAAAPSWQVG